MQYWHLNQDYRNRLGGQLFATLENTFAVKGQLVARDPLSQVFRVEAGGECYYVKRYIGNGKTARRRWFGLRALIGRQRVKREWENLNVFRQWGLPAAELVAYGLERSWGGFVRGALITAEIANTRDLAKMAADRDPRLKDRRWVGAVSSQVARIARRMHDHRFAHNDLKWRNLLVEQGAIPTVHLIDCPCGCHWWWPFLEYRVVKDLACLDKVAKYHLTRTQRLRFYLEYAGTIRLSTKDKRRIAKIVHFFDGRE